MKILLYVLGLLTWAAALLLLVGVGDSAIRLNVAVSLWIATLVALGAAAICGRLEQAATAAAKDRAELRKAMAELKPVEKTAPPTGNPPPAAGVTVDESVAAMRAALGDRG